MKKLLNTLYVTNELCYLSKDGENIVVKIEGKEVKRLPIHILQGVICFNYNGVSPGVIKLCANHNISLALLTSNGDLCGRFVGKTNGNVYLRRMQYKIADNTISLQLAKHTIISKISNTRKILKRLVRDHADKVEVKFIEDVCQSLYKQIETIKDVDNKDSLRGIEGESARRYFSCFNQMILKQKHEFNFNGRHKRPPTDKVNALLSYFYSILTYEIQSALEAVGLDSYVGFFHTDRPGRAGLALDIIEELRAYMVDRFVVSLINKLEIKDSHFETKENGSVLLNKEGKSIALSKWQKRKQQEIKHPYIEETCQIGLIPHIQALLLARYIRGDIEAYPPFLL